MQQKPETLVEQRVTLPRAAPLHLRPAGRFVREASRFNANVYVTANGKRVNAKSILEVVALGAVGGTELVLDASGEEAAEAVAQLAALVSTLG